MMDRQHGIIKFECDVCGDTLDTDTRDFNESKRVQDREGWKARKIGEIWCHSCPKCGIPGERAPLARNAKRLPL